MSEDELLSKVCSIAVAAGAILRDGFGSSMSVQSKSGRHNLVTEFDIRVESFLHEQLTSLIPNSSFLGEEGGHRDGSRALTWVVDPLDGTVNFAHGIPIFCVSIAAVVEGNITLGVIYAPMIGELFSTIRGKGAWLHNRRLQVSSTATLADSMLVTGFPYDVSENPDRCIEQFASLLRLGLPVRRLGSAALDLAYTAAGRFDGYFEVRLQPWDMAAGALMVREAGGSVTHYANQPFVLERNSIVASNGTIHQELINLLSSS